MPHVRYVDELVDVPVVTQSHAPTIQTVVETGEMSQAQHIDKVIDDVPVPQIQEQTVEVVKIIPERVQQSFVEQIVDVPVPPATAQERISECIVGPSLVQQSRQTPLEDTLPSWDKPADEPQFDLAEGAVGIIVSLHTETERGLAVTQATDEQQASTQKEFCTPVTAHSGLHPEGCGVRIWRAPRGSWDSPTSTLTS